MSTSTASPDLTAKTCVLFIQGGGEGAHAMDKALADALQQALGPNFDVRFPRMPDEDAPSAPAWKQKIATELAQVHGPLMLVAHSLGGSVLLRYLAEEKVDRAIAGLFLLAAPAWDGDRWSFDELKLPDDMAQRLDAVSRIVLYHCRDDDVVPFAHLALHGKQLPQALVRAYERGGHQLDGHMVAIAEDLRGDWEGERAD